MWRHLDRAALPRPARLLQSVSQSRRSASSKPDGNAAFTRSQDARRIPKPAGSRSHGSTVSHGKPSDVETEFGQYVRPRPGYPKPSAVIDNIVYKPGDPSTQPPRASTSIASSLPSSKGKEADRSAANEPTKKPRTNAVGVQLLSPSLHSQLFPEGNFKQPLNHLVMLSKRHLQDHGLEPGGSETINEINFVMPPLQGENIRQHFRNIGRQTAEPYLSLAKEFSVASLPPAPEVFATDQPGWIRYDQDGSFEPVDDLGDEKMISFDVEVLYKLSPYPVMACAASPTHWYSWLSPAIFDDPLETPLPIPPKWDKSVRQDQPKNLIPLFSGDQPRIAIGHNVGYDRARVAEEYSLDSTPTRWMDTLSLHAASRGISSNQTPAWHSYRSKKRSEESMLDAIMDSGDSDLISRLSDGDDDVEAATRWEDITAINSLAEVAALHCGYAVDKSMRSRFGDESITHASQLRDELQELLQYNAEDVRVTHDVYTKVFPIFLESCPHPASFAGILPMGTSFLPVDKSWSQYLKSSEDLYRQMEANVKAGLRVLADNARREGPKDDPWLEQLDWSEKKARWATEGDTPVSTPSASILTEESTESSTAVESAPRAIPSDTPAWLAPILTDPDAFRTSREANRILPLLLRMTFRGHYVAYTSKGMWCFRVPKDMIGHFSDHEEVPLTDADAALFPCLDDSVFLRVGRHGSSKVSKLLGQAFLKKEGDRLGSPNRFLLKRVISGSVTADDILRLANEAKARGQNDPWGMQLDWAETSEAPAKPTRATKAKTPPKPKNEFGTWPKWYWELTSPHSEDLDLTQKKTVTPLLLRLQWHGYPLIRHPEFRWLYRVPSSEVTDSMGEPVFVNESEKINESTQFNAMDYKYFRLPHKDGEGKNVGSPFARPFLKAIESGELAPAVDTNDASNEMARIAADAMNLNVLCSYWISSRERIMDQMVVFKDEQQAMILPQVITMGTVTRRSVESTWLTASNVKAKRVGSELKAMVKAPPGYSIIGADVDSEELWLGSVMSDAQFGFHGATAIGYMTLEGSKAKGTDLHSKTASILGTSRDAAKVFNYSRIYGAGQKHAIQLLRQGDPNLSKEEAQLKAVNLYEATKGLKARRSTQRPTAAFSSIWHGGSESFLFNLIESIAGSESPRTPALGCGVTSALRKGYLEDGSAYLPSRTNWVVQSSGVDYLHLLITSMEYLIKTYDIKARYLISVHDEVRYLAKEEDRYRTALALQIANAWTRALFCYNIGMDDVPQSVAFFSAVDLDHVLRKEVYLSCQTPSHPEAIPPGESLDMEQLLERTNGDLGAPVTTELVRVDEVDEASTLPLYANIDSQPHFEFLRAQTDRSPALAARWLERQPPLLDVMGQPLPKAKNERRTVIKAALKADPGHFQAQRDRALTFTNDEIEEIARSFVPEEMEETKGKTKVVKGTRAKKVAKAKEEAAGE